jgi:hypothetical protein
MRVFALLLPVSIVSTFAIATTPAVLTSYPASNPSYFRWEGRTALSNVTEGGVYFDLEGTALTFEVANATYIGLNISDATTSGMRLGVYIDSTGAGGGFTDPDPSGRAVPGVRVATLLTSPYQSLYTLGFGGQIKGLNSTTNAFTVRVVNLAEWSMSGDFNGAVLTVVAIVTDGILQRAPAPKLRRFLVLGDSLSSGVGCGFNVPPSGSPCGAGVLVDDWSATWNALLCVNFSASCEVIAKSGATIVANAQYNIPMSIPYALGAMGTASWPVASRVVWNPVDARVDAILIELGENDEHSNVTDTTLVDAYVKLVKQLALSYGPPQIPTFFVTPNHEAGQSRAMILAVTNLTQQGFNRVFFVNGTSPNVDPVTNTSIDNGCGGHPSAAQSIFAFERIQLAMASVLGW